MYGAPGSKSSKKIQSGTPEHPTPKDLFASMIAELLESGTWSWVHFEDNRSRGWIEVALDANDVLVNFGFPFKNAIEAIFSERRIKIPKSWRIDYFKKEKAATFRLNKSETNIVVFFLDVVFRKLYECPSNYSVGGNFQC